MKNFTKTLLINILSLFLIQVTFAQNLYQQCDGVDNPEDVEIQFPIHPLLLNEEGRNSGWSIITPYGGCPNTCDANSPFDCCPVQICEPYEIPVVFTLLADASCACIILLSL